MDPADRLELAADRLEAALARDELPDLLRDVYKRQPATFATTPTVSCPMKVMKAFMVSPLVFLIVIGAAKDPAHACLLYTSPRRLGR